MVFSSSIFLFAFSPLFLVVYFAVPSIAAKNVVLLAFSLLFYAWGEPVYVFLMIASILVNWGFAIGISRNRRGGCKSWLIVALVANIGTLCLFKYENFFALNANRVLGEGFVAELGLDLPIGISFFTLQAISYIVDVYRGRVGVQRNPLYLGMYIAMFPQLVAGPIVRYAQIEAEIKSRRTTMAGFAQGLRLFLVGLSKKCLLANTCAVLASSLLSQEAMTIGMIGCLSGALAYTFQIYFDFSGYSDMAIGLGKMMGFDYPRNFNYPYTSRSVTEFWRRWHMTLGSFFRDYVYIPLGGSRVSTPRWMLNIMIVWALTGIWHGAAWNFLLWGLYYGTLLMCEKLFLLRLLDRLPRFVGHTYCVVVFLLGWVLFSVTGLGNVLEWIAGLFGAYGIFGTSTLWELQSWSYVSLLPILVVASTPIIPYLRKRLEAWAAGEDRAPEAAAPEKGNEGVPPCEAIVAAPFNRKRAHVVAVVNAACDVCLVVLAVLSCMSIVSGGYNPFIYFQF